MIISASYKTDIPAFYGEWFAARLAAGRAFRINPWNGRVIETSLAAADVDGFVFWTRNAKPFLHTLQTVADRAPFTVQYTITGYPHALERSVVPPDNAVETVVALANCYGPRAIVWRYDPIVLSEITPFDWHVENFARLARRLEGAVDEVVASFAQIYAKTRRNLDSAAAREEFEWWDPPDEQKRDLVERFADIAIRHGMRLTLCAQPELLAVRPISDRICAAACVDPHRLFGPGAQTDWPRSKNRPGCLCAEASDIGHYETCPHGCVYCYAVSSHDKAKANHAGHLPTAELISGSQRGQP
jgi:DNA repair photolyase